jgi:hypothetical protein
MADLRDLELLEKLRKTTVKSEQHCDLLTEARLV